MSFFFQAEDGIRDTSVTGVQTCALPISVIEHRQPIEVRRDTDAAWPFHALLNRDGAPQGGRSEERRVGKEGRDRRERDERREEDEPSKWRPQEPPPRAGRRRVTGSPAIE